MNICGRHQSFQLYFLCAHEHDVSITKHTSLLHEERSLHNTSLRSNNLPSHASISLRTPAPAASSKDCPSPAAMSDKNIEYLQFFLHLTAIFQIDTANYVRLLNDIASGAQTFEIYDEEISISEAHDLFKLALWKNMVALNIVMLFEAIRFFPVAKRANSRRKTPVTEDVLWQWVGRFVVIRFGAVWSWVWEQAVDEVLRQSDEG